MCPKRETAHQTHTAVCLCLFPAIRTARRTVPEQVQLRTEAGSGAEAQAWSSRSGTGGRETGRTLKTRTTVFQPVNHQVMGGNRSRSQLRKVGTRNMVKTKGESDVDVQGPRQHVPAAPTHLRPISSTSRSHVVSVCPRVPLPHSWRDDRPRHG